VYVYYCTQKMCGVAVKAGTWNGIWNETCNGNNAREIRNTKQEVLSYD